MNKLMNRKLMAIIFTSAMMLFLYGCGTAPTGVDMSDTQAPDVSGVETAETETWW